jgi:hypothetical protein
MDLSNHAKGWIAFIAALGMMLTLESVEIGNLSSWSDVYQPSFIAKLLAHLGTVIGAFLGGRLIPTPNNEQG